MKIRSWKQARAAARALDNWLSTHCPACGMRHTDACIEGGRCTNGDGPDGNPCGCSLSSIGSLAQAVSEAASLLT